MSAIEKRVTKGQVALVCGLVLAFQRLEVACRIAAVHPKTIKRYLPPHWASPQVSRSPYFGERLEAIQAAWSDETVPTEKLRRDFGLTRGQLRHLVKQFRFPKRSKGRRTDPLAVEAMAPARHRYYLALRASGLSYEDAKAAAWKAAFGNSGGCADLPRPASAAARVSSPAPPAHAMSPAGRETS